MSRREIKKTQIWSIFGQVEEVVATQMVNEGKLNRIEPQDIPPTAMYREGDDTPAKFAVVVPAAYKGEFERRIADLRA